MAALLAAAMVTAAPIAIGLAANPDPAPLTNTPPCWWQGSSFHGSSSFSNTSRAGGTCASQFHVHAYFWNGSAYDYDEATGFGTVIQVNYGSSSWIWGYHEYPLGSNQVTSHAD